MRRTAAGRMLTSTLIMFAGITPLQAIPPAGGMPSLTGTVLEPGITSKDGAVALHDSVGPLPETAWVRQKAQQALHASLTASAFADEASEARDTLMASANFQQAPQSLIELVLENEKASRHAAALAQTRSQASWDAVSRFEHDISQSRAADRASASGWHDQPVPIEYAHVSAELFNPAILFLGGASAPGRALVAFRQQLRNQQRVCATCDFVETYYHSSVAFALYEMTAPSPHASTEASSRLRQSSPLVLLHDSDLFGADHPFGCAQLQGGFNFGPEDPRLIHLPPPQRAMGRAGSDAAEDAAEEAWMLFHARAHFRQAGVACGRIGETQSGDPDAPLGYTVSREQGLQPYMVPLLVSEDGSVRADTARLVQLHARSDDKRLRLHAIEKNWSPFTHTSRLYAVYATAPNHVVLSVDMHSGVVKEAYSTPNKACLSAAPSKLCAGETLPNQVHGGGGVVLIEADLSLGINETHYLSVLHTVSEWSTYSSYLYRFRAEPPFDVLSIAQEPLPLQSSKNGWGAVVAFPVSVAVAADPNGRRFVHISYGKGDRESRVLSIPLARYGAISFRGGRERPPPALEDTPVFAELSTSQPFDAVPASKAGASAAALVDTLVEDRPELTPAASQDFVSVWPVEPVTGRRLPRMSRAALSTEELKDTRLTVVMLSHREDRLKDAVDIISKYATMPDTFAACALIWNDPKTHPLSTDTAEARVLATVARASAENMTVSLFESSANSMNARFVVWPHIRTRGVFLQDDDMWLEPSAVRCLHGLWHTSPSALVGAAAERTDFLYPNPRQSEQQKSAVIAASSRGSLPPPGFTSFFELTPQGCEQTKDGRTQCTYPSGRHYSMLLPHPWLFARDYMPVYLAQRPLVWLVDNMTNCDDIFFNAVVANASGLPPMASEVEVYRHPTWMNGGAMWMQDSKWLAHRTECMARVQEHFAPRLGRSGSAFVSTPTSPPHMQSNAVWRRTDRLAACPAVASDQPA